MLRRNFLTQRAIRCATRSGKPHCGRRYCHRMRGLCSVEALQCKWEKKLLLSNGCTVHRAVVCHVYCALCNSGALLHWTLQVLYGRRYYYHQIDALRSAIVYVNSALDIAGALWEKILRSLSPTFASTVSSVFSTVFELVQSEI